MPEIGPNTRLRTSPFYTKTLEAGVTAFSPYNRMLMPVSYGDPVAEYEQLMHGVSMWDVGVERQVQLHGPDAAKLAQVLCVRDLSRCKIRQGMYVPMCDHDGVLINDPIVLKLADDLYWFSIADNNILLWARCVAAERGFNVEVTEPDVSPLAIQGPHAEDVVASMFGEQIRHLKYFWFDDAEIDGIRLKIARSGYSKQGGFELYLMDSKHGSKLWDLVREAGKPWHISAGYPNPIERIESGLLSYGGDTDNHTNPFEVRLDKYVDLKLDNQVIGISALRAIAEKGVKRHQLGIKLHDSEPGPGHALWYDVYHNEQKVGDMTNGAWSAKAGCTIGFVLIDRQHTAGDQVVVHKENKEIAGTLQTLPFF